MALQSIQKQRPYPNQILDEVPDALGLVIAIPCYREDTIIPLLESLAACAKTNIAVEVILVIVTSDQDNEQIIQENQHTYWEAEAWTKNKHSLPFMLHTLHFQGVPHEVMGVDLARKIGLDEGADRLMVAREPQGVLATLDADALVPPNYLTTLVEKYHQEPGIVTVTTQVELRVSKETTDQERQLIQWASLEQCYLRQGSLEAGYPLAQYSHASGVSCRAWAYRQAGGLLEDKRMGLERLWQKLAVAGRAESMEEVTVSVKPRFKSRHPKGMGARLERLAHQGITQFKVVEPKAFRMLAAAMEFGRDFQELHNMRQFQEALESLPYPVRAFLIEQKVHQLWRKWHTQQTSQMSGWFTFLNWFDRTRWEQALQFWSTQSFAKIPVEEAVAEWLESISGFEEESLQPEYLLERLRQIRKGKPQPARLRRA